MCENCVTHRRAAGEYLCATADRFPLGPGGALVSVLAAVIPAADCDRETFNAHKRVALALLAAHEPATVQAACDALYAIEQAAHWMRGVAVEALRAVYATRPDDLDPATRASFDATMQRAEMIEDLIEAGIPEQIAPAIADKAIRDGVPVTVHVVGQQGTPAEAEGIFELRPRHEPPTVH